MEWIKLINRRNPVLIKSLPAGNRDPLETSTDGRQLAITERSRADGDIKVDDLAASQYRKRTIDGSRGGLWGGFLMDRALFAISLVVVLLSVLNDGKAGLRGMLEGTAFHEIYSVSSDGSYVGIGSYIDVSIVDLKRKEKVDLPAIEKAVGARLSLPMAVRLSMHCQKAASIRIICSFSYPPAGASKFAAAAARKNNAAVQMAAKFSTVAASASWRSP